MSVTKKLLGANGAPSTSTFYAGIFLDEECTEKAEEGVDVVKQVIELPMGGASEKTEQVLVFLTEEDSEKVFYVTETDAAGNPLPDSLVARYDVNVDGEKV